MLMKCIGKFVVSGARPLVDNATNELLSAPDWAANLEAVDFGNASPDHAVALGTALIEKVRSRNDQVAKLALELTRACAKNGNESLLRVVAGPVIDAVAAVGVSSNNGGNVGGIFGALQGGTTRVVSDEALVLVQELGVEFRDKHGQGAGFYRAYSRLVEQGVIFPVKGELGSSNLTSPDSGRNDGSYRQGFNQDDLEGLPPLAALRRGSVAAEEGPRAITGDEIEKLEQDLRFLARKLKIAERVLEDPTLSLESDDALNVLDFLLQCKPRIVEMIDASARGLIPDYFMDDCLKINDDLCPLVDRLKGDAPRLVQRAQNETSANHADETSAEQKAAVALPMLRAPPRARSGSTSSGGTTGSPRAASASKGGRASKRSSLNQQLEADETNLFKLPMQAPPQAPPTTETTGPGDGEPGDPGFSGNPFDFFADQYDEQASLVTKEKQVNEGGQGEQEDLLA